MAAPASAGEVLGTPPAVCVPPVANWLYPPEAFPPLSPPPAPPAELSVNPPPPPPPAIAIAVTCEGAPLNTPE
ncbi:hypothetical protein EJ913_03405 [Azospirillum doebereinerae]|uniref:Uncharacterized protein n=1 Tax=Azospirillum doebereinerae TaxID=92933 RepID=A0A3S0XQ61_9PROT|nr:hypothetical protein EJ913_03405 [Azospirillum doebereinerae]